MLKRNSILPRKLNIILTGFDTTGKLKDIYANIQRDAGRVVCHVAFGPL